jgi:hypothetical protein
MFEEWATDHMIPYWMRDFSVSFVVDSRGVGRPKAFLVAEDGPWNDINILSKSDTQVRSHGALERPLNQLVDPSEISKSFSVFQINSRHVIH